MENLREIMLCPSFVCVQVTGPVISGAGIIMSLAFAGMLATTNNFLSALFLLLPIVMVLLMWVHFALVDTCITAILHLLLSLLILPAFSLQKIRASVRVHNFKHSANY